jgi:pimeloyl-ACP methyl ester carboxylesterase
VSSSATSAGGTAGSRATSSFTERSCWKPNLPGAPATDLGPQFRCGELTVPENRARPNGKTITIAVAIAKAASPTPQKDPILYLNGGPGGTSTVTANLWVQTGFNADRDAIFIDQRGTYHSQPSLTCPDLEQYIDTLQTRSFFDPGTRSAAEAAVKAYHEKITGAGWDPAAYNTRESAADIADLRAVLDIPSWNIYGVSYGTYLALEVLRTHPQGIRSLVLDSVVPPQQSALVGFWRWSALGYEHLLHACDRQAACQAAYPNLRTEFVQAINTLETTPATVTIRTSSGPKTIVVDGFSVANAMVLPSNSPGIMQELPRAIHTAAHGDTSLIANIVGEESTHGVLSFGLEYGVFCGEHLAYSTTAEALAEAKKALPGFPDSVLTPRLPQLPTLQWDCATWNVPQVTALARSAVTSDVPTLVLAGALDAITPPENGEAVLPGLSRSQYVEVPGSGHNTLRWQGACTAPLMNAFLKSPTSPVDTACVKQLSDPTFSTP